MKRIVAIIAALMFVAGCSGYRSGMQEQNEMKSLTIRWQRLVDEKSQTCKRCATTGEEVRKAFRKLKRSLAPLGIEVSLEEKALDPATCSKDVSQSNRIWVGERPLEEWLNAEVGKSPCGFCCAGLGGNVECRTIIIKGQTYEVVPAELITRAGLLAASQLVNVGPKEPCCPRQPSPQVLSSCCPQEEQSSKARK